MKLLKNILTVLILLSLVLNGATVSAKTATTDTTAFDGQFALLAGLNIIVSDGESYEETEVTRARFAKELTTFLGVRVTENDNQYYYDVDRKNPYIHYINTVKDLGYMVGENGYFRPDDLITKIEIIKTVVSAIGYDGLAEFHGGYKNGYIKVANDFGIGKGVGDLDSPALYSDMIRIFYNTLDTDGLELTFSGGNVSYTHTNKTFLQQFHNISKSKGRVTGTNVTSIDGMSKTGKETVRIDGQEYLLTENVTSVDNYLGCYIKFWYNDDNEIVYFEDDSTEELIITSEDYEYYKSNVIYYTDSLLTKRVNIDRNAYVLYNGADVTSQGYSDDIFDISLGSIEVIKNKNSNKYDVVKIYDYKNLIASSVLEKGSEIYAKGRTIKLNDYDVYYLRGANGETKNLADIHENNILSIGESKDKSVLYVIVSDKIMSGTITGMSTNEHNRDVITINGEDIEIDKDYEANGGIDLSAGMAINAYLDYKGKVAYATYSGSSSDWQYGYMMYAYGDETESGLKIYTTESSFKKYELTEKVSLDGVSMRASKAVDKLNEEGGGETAPQLIKYMLSGEKIKRIDTAMPAEYETSKQNLSLYADTKFRYANQNQRFHYYGTDYPWMDYFTALKADDNTIVFVVPDPNGDQVMNEKLYALYKGPSYFWKISEPIYNIAAYDVDEDNGDIAKVMVVKGAPGNDYSDDILMEKITTEVNSEGEVVNVLRGYAYHNGPGELEAWELDSDLKTVDVLYNKANSNGSGMYGEYFKIPLEDVKRGDMLSLVKGADGKVTGIRRTFGLSHLETSMEVLDSDGNPKTVTSDDTFVQKHGVLRIGGVHIGSGGGSEQTVMIGVLTDRHGKYLHMANMNPRTESVKGRGNCTIELNGYSVMHYSSKSNTIESLSNEDIDAYIYSANPNALCYVFTTFTNLRFMVIYD